MKDREGLTRWFGCFRSAGESPISPAQLEHVSAQRANAARGTLLALLFGLGFPAAGYFIVPTLRSGGLIAAAILICFVVGPFVGAVLAAKWLGPWRRLRRIHGGSIVETFSGATDDGDVDTVTKRLRRVKLIQGPGRYEFCVERETGSVLSANGTLARPSVRGRIAVTTARAGAETDHTLTETERLERDLLIKRLVRPRWAVAAALGLTAARACQRYGSTHDIDVWWTNTPGLPGLLVFGIAVFATSIRALVDTYHVRGLTEFQTHGDGLHLGRLLWESGGRPSTERLEDGGLLADRRFRRRYASERRG